MTTIFLHDHPDFADLLRIVADNESIEPVLVEKDYWIMHALWGLSQQGYTFALKGGTSLSKGWNIIDRFSEDIDILIDPPANYLEAVNTKSEKPAAIKSRKDFYDWLTDNISIPGIERVERDVEFDDTRYYRSGGIRLHYKTYFGSLVGVKDGILLEAGFSQVAPNEPRLISAWAYEHAAQTTGLTLIDNRAFDIHCYHPGYTFVEKMHSVIRHFRQETTEGTKKKNFMRQYNDIHSLLATEIVNQFLNDPAYQAHKAAQIKGVDAQIPISEHPAFLLTDKDLVAEYNSRYVSTSNLYYRGQIAFTDIVANIQLHLHRM